MRKAIVNEKSGLVENLIVAGDDFDPGPGKLLLDAGNARIGGTWDGEQFTPPPDPEPPAPQPGPIDAELAALSGTVASIADTRTREFAQGLLDALKKLK